MRDVASSIANSLAVIQGGSTAVFVDSCVGPDGRLRMYFGNAVLRLQQAFASRKVTSEDIISINLHERGFHLRLALDDINHGLANPKFMRSHFYRAVESLRHSVTGSLGLAESAQWEAFRNKLNIDRARIEALMHHPERHGDYARALPMSSSEVEVILEIIAEVISQYVKWFKANVH